MLLANIETVLDTLELLELEEIRGIGGIEGCQAKYPLGESSVYANVKVNYLYSQPETGPGMNHYYYFSSSSLYSSSRTFFTPLTWVTKKNMLEQKEELPLLLASNNIYERWPPSLYFSTNLFTIYRDRDEHDRKFNSISLHTSLHLVLWQWHELCCSMSFGEFTKLLNFYANRKHNEMIVIADEGDQISIIPIIQVLYYWSHRTICKCILNGMERLRKNKHADFLLLLYTRRQDNG